MFVSYGARGADVQMSRAFREPNHLRAPATKRKHLHDLFTNLAAGTRRSPASKGCHSVPNESSRQRGDQEAVAPVVLAS
jgi:hypothetical protein